MDWLQVLAFEKPSIDLDITLFIQLAIFILLFLALRKYILTPYFHAYEKRASMTSGAREEAKKLAEKAKVAQEEYETARQAVYAKAESSRREVIGEANKEAAEVLEEARTQAHAEIVRKQAELDKEIAEAREAVKPEIASISKQIAQKILV